MDNGFVAKPKESMQLRNKADDVSLEPREESIGDLPDTIPAPQSENKKPDSPEDIECLNLESRSNTRIDSTADQLNPPDDTDNPDFSGKDYLTIEQVKYSEDSKPRDTLQKTQTNQEFLDGDAVILNEDNVSLIVPPHHTEPIYQETLYTELPKYNHTTFTDSTFQNGISSPSLHSPNVIDDVMMDFSKSITDLVVEVNNKIYEINDNHSFDSLGPGSEEVVQSHLHSVSDSNLLQSTPIAGPHKKTIFDSFAGFKRSKPNKRPASFHTIDKDVFDGIQRKFDEDKGKIGSFRSKFRKKYKSESRWVPVEIVPDKVRKLF